MSQVIAKVKRQQRRSGKGGTEQPLREIRFDVAGIDIGATENYISCRPQADGQPNVRVFRTDTQSLTEAADWMESEGVRSVVMESTGVYWIPLYQVLTRRGFEVNLVDARAVRGVPGRKTDVIDCQWLRQLHACGLLKGCFLPDTLTASLRSLQRMRQTLRRSQDDWIRRIQKQLDLMNVRVHRAVSDITGVTGMAILRAILGGERDPQVLAALRDRRCRKSKEEIARELTGDWREEHLSNLAVAMATYDHFTAQIGASDENIDQRLAQIRIIREAAGKPVAAVVPPHPSEVKGKRMLKRGEEPMRQALAHTFGIDLTRIESVSVETAACVFMELGPDIPERFPTEKKFVAYLRLAPGLAISGGQPVHRKSKAPRRGSLPLKRNLLTAAATLRESKTALGDYYRKVSFRKGAGVAAFATAAKLAQRIYRALAYGIDYAVGGDERWHRVELERRRARLARQAATLGMTIVPATVPASL
jgi:transposase